MGAAWRSPKARDMDVVVAMVEGVKALGMETCMTLGMLSDDDVVRLRDAGLDYYNHNVDTSEAYYDKIITTRTYAERLDTLARVRESGMKVCSGGIVGMGEGRDDRADMLVTLANLEEHPESVPINMLVAIPGTPLENAERIDPIDFVRTIAVARIMMPKSFVRLSAGRTEMSDETQALCFFAGANSIFVGDTLLTADNPGDDKDSRLFAKLGLSALELNLDPSSIMSPDLARDGRMSGNHERALDALLRRGRLRALETPHGIDFTSNDYLGLAQSRELADAIVQAIARGVPVGAGGSRLLRGNHPEHEALEARSSAVLRCRNGAVFRRRLYRQHRISGNPAIARRSDRL